MSHATNQLAFPEFCARTVEIDPRSAEKWWALSTSPMEIHLAGDIPDLTFGSCKVFVGDRPFVLDFQSLAMETLAARVEQWTSGGKTSVPAIAEPKQDVAHLSTLQDLRSSWRYYLVVYGIGVEKSDRLHEISFKVSYLDKDVTIVDLWPRPERREVVKVGGRATANIDLHGKFCTDELGAGAIFKALELPLGAKLEVGGKGEVVAQISFEYSALVVEAYGVAAASGGWMIRRTRAKETSQHIFCHMIHAPKKVENVGIKVVVGGVYRGWFEFPAAAETPVNLDPIQLRPQ
jgi:hypothetical protein